MLETGSRRIILASQSPRRIELLKKIIDRFEVAAANIDESIVNAQSPADAVVEISHKKAMHASQNIASGIIIAADSIVVVDGQILSKPRTYDESLSMLRALSGKVHQVYTGVTVIDIPDQYLVSDVAVTDVKFRELDCAEIRRYIQTNHPFDKAGSYGIQDDAAVFIEYIKGCAYNVMGLPVSKIYLILKKLFDKGN